MDHLDKIREVYDLERNAEISWFWDGGFKVRIGDPLNGISDDNEGFRTIEEAIDWLHARIMQTSPPWHLKELKERRGNG